MAERYKNFQKGTIMSKIQAKMLDEESAGGQDSWIELQGPPSRDSTCSIAMCSDSNVLLMDAQKSAAVSRHSFSPKSLQSPNVEFDTQLEAVKFKLARDVDWIWDWSSRPEQLGRQQQGYFRPSSNMITPPNSPIMNSNTATAKEPTNYRLFKSLRHTKWIRKRWFSWATLSIWMATNLCTFLLGISAGYFLLYRYNRLKMIK